MNNKLNIFKVIIHILLLIILLFTPSLYSDGSGGTASDRDRDSATRSGSNDNGSETEVDDSGEPGDEEDEDDCKECPCEQAPTAFLSKSGIFSIGDVPIWYDSKLGPEFRLKLSYQTDVYKIVANEEPMGNNWSVKYLDFQLVEEAGGYIFYHGNGEAEKFVKQNSVWQQVTLEGEEGQGLLGRAEAGNTLWEDSESPTVILHRKDGTHIAFLGSGDQFRLIWIADKFGDKLTFQYGSNPSRFNSVRTADNKIFKFSYYQGKPSSDLPFDYSVSKKEVFVNDKGEEQEKLPPRKTFEEMVHQKLKSVSGPYDENGNEIPGVTGTAEFKYEMVSDKHGQASDEFYEDYQYLLLSEITDIGGRTFEIKYTNQNINGESRWMFLQVPRSITELGTGGMTTMDWFGQNVFDFSRILTLTHPDGSYIKLQTRDASGSAKGFKYWTSESGSELRPLYSTPMEFDDNSWIIDEGKGIQNEKQETVIFTSLDDDGIGTGYDENGDSVDYSVDRPYLARFKTEETRFDKHGSPLGQIVYQYYEDEAQLSYNQNSTSLTDVYQKFGHLYQKREYDRNGDLLRTTTYHNLVVDPISGKMISQDIEVTNPDGSIAYRSPIETRYPLDLSEKFPDNYPFNVLELPSGVITYLNEAETEYSETATVYYDSGKVAYRSTRFDMGVNDFNVDKYYTYYESGDAWGRVREVWTPGESFLQVNSEKLLVSQNGLNRVSYTYGQNGEVETETRDYIESDGSVTTLETVTYDYDKFYQKTKATYASDSTFELWYYGCCGLETYTDRDGNYVLYERDERKRIVREIKMTRTGYKYEDTKYILDFEGKVLKSTDVYGQEKSYDYDLAGQLTYESEFSGHKVFYGYDDYDRQYYEIDARGLITRFFYDDLGNQIHTVMYANAEDAKVSDQSAELSETTPLRADDGQPFIESRTYDSEGRIIKIFDAYKHDPATYAYDLTDYTMFYEYDYAGRTEKVYTNSDVGISYRETVYGIRNEVLKEYASVLSGQQPTNAELSVENVYDQNGILLYSVGPEYIPGNDASVKVRKVQAYNYDPRFLKVNEVKFAIIDAATTISETNLDPLTYTTVSSSVFDDQGRVFSRTSGGETQTYSFSLENNLRKTEVAFSDGSTSENYFNGPLLIKSVDRNGVELNMEYEYSRLIKRVSSRLDSGGVPIAQSIVYDNAGRVLSEINHLGEAKSYEYNYNGQVTITKFEDDSEQFNTYNLLGQLIEQRGANTYPIKFEYDANYQRIKMIDGNGSETKWSYTQNGQVKQKWYDGSLENEPDLSYIYDIKGQLAERQDKRGVVTKYWYDNLGRLRGTDYPEFNPITGAILSAHRSGLVDFITQPLLDDDVLMVYDEFGRRGTVTGPTGSTSYLYDGNTYRVARETNSYGISVSRSFENSDLDLLYLGTDPNNTNYKVDYGFQNGRLNTVVSDGHSIQYNYLTNTNFIDSVSFNSDALVSQRSYDDANRWTGITHTKKNLPANDFTTTSYSYLLDSQGRRTERTVVKGGDTFTTTYGYNDRSEVVSAVYSNNYPIEVKQYGFGYDEIGNRIENTQNDLEVSGTFNSLNQATKYNYSGEMPYYGSVTPQNGNALSTVTVNGSDAGTSGELSGEVTIRNGKKIFVLAEDSQGKKSSVTKELPNERPLTYDLNGNLETDGTWTYYWNVENRLVQMENAETRLKFEYDHEGRRIKKQVYSYDGMNWNLSDEKRFLYDGWNMIAELDGSNAVERTFVWGEGSNVGNLLMMSVVGGSNFYYTYDINGNTTSYIDATTLNVVTEYEYSPFGKMIQGEEDVVNPYAFATQYCDFETYFVYYGLRYYDGEKSRWLNKDPIAENGGLNLYSFVLNNPINYIDYLGLFVTLVDYTGKEINNGLSVRGQVDDSHAGGSFRYDVVEEANKIGLTCGIKIFLEIFYHSSSPVYYQYQKGDTVRYKPHWENQFDGTSEISARGVRNGRIRRISVTRGMLWAHEAGHAQDFIEFINKIKGKLEKKFKNAYSYEVTINNYIRTLEATHFAGKRLDQLKANTFTDAVLRAYGFQKSNSYNSDGSWSFRKP